MAARLVPTLRTVVVVLAVAVMTAYVAGLPAAAPDRLADVGAVAVDAVVLLVLVVRAWQVPAQRLAWSAFALSLCAYLGAEVYALGEPAGHTGPSWADAGWLLFPVLAFAGLLALIHVRIPSSRAMLDAAIAGLGGAAMFSAFILDVILGAPEVEGLATALALAYPVADVMLVGALSAQLALGRWDGLSSTMIMCSFGLLVLGDTAYAAPVGGSHLSEQVVAAIFVLSISILGLAALQRSRPVAGRADRDPLRISVWFAVGALIVLMVASRARLSVVTVALAGMTLFAVVLRAVAAFRELEAVSRARHREARRDALTGLANRRAVLEELDGLRERQAPAALLLLDLDRFKQVNDVHGHQAGDDLLRQVAGRLVEVAGAATLVGRLGGDEFVLVAGPPGHGALDADDLARRVRERLRDTYRLTGSEGDVSAGIDVSIGIAMRDDGDADALLRDADLAMYQAKRAGGGHLLFQPAAGFPIAS